MESVKRKDGSVEERFIQWNKILVDEKGACEECGSEEVLFIDCTAFELMEPINLFKSVKVDPIPVLYKVCIRCKHEEFTEVH